MTKRIASRGRRIVVSMIASQGKPAWPRGENIWVKERLSSRKADSLPKESWSNQRRRIGVPRSADCQAKESLPSKARRIQGQRRADRLVLESQHNQRRFIDPLPTMTPSSSSMLLSTPHLPFPNPCNCPNL